MPRVRFLTWSPGLKKVQLTKLIRESVLLPLDEAHGAVNRLLAGEQVEFQIDAEEDALRFADQADRLGVLAEFICEVVPTPQ